jgi:hypothetical protein
MLREGLILFISAMLIALAVGILIGMEVRNHGYYCESQDLILPCEEFGDSGKVCMYRNPVEPSDMVGKVCSDKWRPV